MCCDLAQAEVAKSSGCEFTTYPAKAVNSVPNRSELPPDFAVRGASVRGRVSSVPLKKANWLADRLHSIGRFEGRRQSIPGKWTRWGLSEGQEGKPIRTEAMGGLPTAVNREGVPKALIRRGLLKRKWKKMKKINPKYQLHRISDLPWNAKTVRIERVEGARRSAQEVLLLHEGKVYTLSWRAGDVRSSPSMLPAFRRLTGMKDRELRQARKDYLAEAEADRNSERTRELERRASKLGYKLVVA